MRKRIKTNWHSNVSYGRSCRPRGAPVDRAVPGAPLVATKSQALQNGKPTTFKLSRSELVTHNETMHAIM